MEPLLGGDRVCHQLGGLIRERFRHAAPSAGFGRYL